MARRPRTRAESQALTRERLITSATELYLQNGYVGTTNDQVAANAGYSRGALYSNFASKEDLGLEVLDRFLASEVEAVALALGSGSLDDRLAALAEWIRAVASERRWWLLKAELAVASRGSDSLRSALAERDAMLRSAAEGIIGRMLDDLEPTRWPLPAHLTARVFLSALKGVSLELIVDDAAATGPDEVIQFLRRLTAAGDVLEPGPESLAQRNSLTRLR